MTPMDRQSLHVGVQGYAPGVVVAPGNPEAEKYGRLWACPEYRRVAPGEDLAPLFLQIAQPRPGGTVLDFGCGTGRGALRIAALGQLRVTMVDFVGNCLDPEVRQALATPAPALSFLKADLTQPLPVAAEWGYCTDVLEHIPPAQLDAVLDHVLRAAQHVFLSISTVEDQCGALIGEPLHLTIRPYGWWLDQLQRRGCLIHWSQEAATACYFYVTAWVTGEAVVEAGRLNISDTQIRNHVRRNCAGGWAQVSPHATNDLEVMLLGGGPSLSAYEQDIKRKRAEGVKLVTMNGTYGWALDHGLTPSAQIVVDARAFNARFTKPVVESCVYLIASQCDPSVLDGLPQDRTYLWHTTTEMVRDLLQERYEVWWGIPGGSTVLLRAIPLMRLLGYRQFHLYGCDSCLVESEHHAYPQAENAADMALPVVVTGGRVFWCHPWMLVQAQEFMALIRYLGHEIELAVYGPGLLAHILDTGASFAPADDGGDGHGGRNLEDLREG